jgi:hypothetical protein
MHYTGRTRSLSAAIPRVKKNPDLRRPGQSRTTREKSENGQSLLLLRVPMNCNMN